MSRRPDLVPPEGLSQAPAQAIWEGLSEAERARVVAALPPMPEAEFGPPEGQPHFNAKLTAFDALSSHLRRLGRRAWVGTEVTIYYPEAARFAPDLVVVFDVEDRERMTYVVSAEGKGLDFVLEVHFGGDRRKDAELNVERYATLGIPEYFLFDRRRGRLYGWRLPPSGAPYEPILPQGGRWCSGALGLDLSLEGDRIRFHHGNAAVFDTWELLGRLQRAHDEALAAAEVEAHRAEAQTRRAEKEARRANSAERRLVELENELAQLHELHERGD